MADIHMFDVRVAELYGVNGAVILQNIHGALFQIPVHHVFLFVRQQQEREISLFVILNFDDLHDDWSCSFLFALMPNHGFVGTPESSYDGDTLSYFAKRFNTRGIPFYFWTNGF